MSKFSGKFKIDQFQAIGDVFGLGEDSPAVPTAPDTPDDPTNPAQESVVMLDPADILPYPRHTYHNISEQEMLELEESIKTNGVIQPAIVRLNAQGQYEMIAGHQRRQACGNIGELLPCIVRQLDDDAADIAMVDGNKQREVSLFEKARSQRLKYEAMRRQGERTDLSGSTDAGKLSLEKMADDDNTSASTVYRVIRLGYLNDNLLELIEQKRIDQMGGVELSFLAAESQNHVADYLLTHEKERLNKQQAAALREKDEKTPLTADKVAVILEKPVKQEKKKGGAVSIPAKRIDQVFADKGISFENKKDMIDFIIAAVQAYEIEREDEDGQTNSTIAEEPA